MKKTRNKYPLNFNDPTYYMRRLIRVHGVPKNDVQLNFLSRNGQIQTFDPFVTNYNPNCVLVGSSFKRSKK